MRTALPKMLIAPLAGLALLVGCASAQAQPADGTTTPDTQVDYQAGEQPAKPEADVKADAKADPEAVKLLERIEAASSDIRTLTARVRYTRTQSLTGDMQQRFGDFYYAASDEKTPTRFAMLFDRVLVDGKARPMETWYVFDGHWLLERDHADKSATRRELVPKGAERSDVLSMGDGKMPIPLRLKADEVLKTYNVVRLEDEPFDKDRVLIHLRLTPKQAGKDASPLELWFDKETLDMRKVVTMEDDDEIEMLFPRSEANAEIKKGTFDTALPDKSDGWQVQEVPIEE